MLCHPLKMQCHINHLIPLSTDLHFINAYGHSSFGVVPFVLLRKKTDKD